MSSIHSCAALWVGDFKEQEDGEILDEGAAALLTYLECLDEANPPVEHGLVNGGRPDFVPTARARIRAAESLPDMS